MGVVFEFPYRTVAEISLQALSKNLATLRSLCRKEIIPVVKADAYGHGILPVAKVLLSRGSCQVLAVATLEEAIQLRKQFERPFTILVLSGFLPHQLDAYCQYNLVPVIHSLSHLKSLLGKQYLPQIHLKIDSGMNRLGIKTDELTDTVAVLKKLPDKLAGLASHFSDSEDLSSGFVNEQLAVFEHWYRQLNGERLLHTDARIHVGNSGAILRDSLGLTNAVRPGLSLYGLSPNVLFESGERLVPVLQWKTRILCIKKIEAGETVGYGRTYQAEKSGTIAIAPVGYADGFPRVMGERGWVLCGGKRVPLRGRVSMDLMAFDCSDLPDVKEGDQVILIGNDGKELITAHDIANWTGTICYEVLCGLSPRVPRIYFDAESN